MSFYTPILFLIFDRPGVTARVFEEIRKQKPKYLYVAADGPRTDKPHDVEKCAAARLAVTSNIDWDCEVKTLFRDNNLGCGRAVSGAINWFFDHVEEGIIVEDDCLPDQSFFTFAAELLARYRHHPEIMHIGGSNFQGPKFHYKYSYYFSKYIHIWGWATWKRAWSLYDFEVVGNGEYSFENTLKTTFKNSIEQGFWRKTFNLMANTPIDTWDTQWMYSFTRHQGIGITPAKNLISNIGFGPEATHTHTPDISVTALPVETITLIKHPETIKILANADRRSYRRLYQFGDTHFNRVKFKIGQKVPLIKKVYLKLFKAGI